MSAPATKGILRTNIKDMQIGDYIAAYYTSGASGLIDREAFISAAAQEVTSSEIPVEGAATSAANVFYFVKVAKGLLVADRVVQTNLTWMTLLTENLIEGLTWGIRNIVPKMTSDISEGGSSFADSLFDGTGEYASWKAFDKTATGNWTSAVSAFPHYIGYQFTQPKLVTAYAVRSRSRDSNDLTGAPKDWEFQAWDGQQWITLDKRTGITWSGKGQRKVFTFTNELAYSQYRLLISSNNGYSQSTVTIGELELFETAGVIRSLSGGNSYLDTNGLSSKLENGLGCWPTANEWDTYIANFPPELTQEGKTVDDIFHWNSAATWCQETPITGFFSPSTSSSPSNTSRIVRGKYRDGYAYSVKSADWEVATAQLATGGFRPVFDYKE